MVGFPQKTLQEVLRDIELFAEDEGRRPRMLVVKLGQDGDNSGARAIAIAFADIGFDVDVAPLWQSPADAARQAIENDVHVVGVSTRADHMTLVPVLIQALKDQGGDDILVVMGGVVPSEDHPMLRAAGVAGIYGPGTDIPAAAAEILGMLRDNRKAA
jgi:methylmalonyl-CoA mutase